MCPSSLDAAENDEGKRNKKKRKEKKEGEQPNYNLKREESSK